MRRLTPPRILIVDDNRAIHDDFRKIFGAMTGASPELEAAEASLFGETAEQPSGFQFRVDSAYQGEEAIEKVRAAVAEKDPYEMAFMDVRMPPGMDGVETTLALWQICPDLQVVLCTAYADYSWDQLHQRFGHTDRLVILKKPFDNIEVLQLAHAMTEKWRLLQLSRSAAENLERLVAERTAELVETNRRLEGEIVERRAVEQALRQSQEMLLRQERLAVVGQLAAGVAHDFNNIMTIIQGHAGMLLDTCESQSEAHSSALEISAAAARAARLTQQLLAFSRKQVMRLVNVDLGRVVQGVSTMLKRALGETISLELALEANTPAVRADAAQIEQILLNLVVNARDAMPRGGVVTIGTRVARVAEPNPSWPDSRAGDFVVLSVRDTGCGMEPATLQKVFEPFFTTKDVGKGTGLGLATVYGITRQHHGWVEVESAVGQGSEFRVFLPQAIEPKLERV